MKFKWTEVSRYPQILHLWISRHVLTGARLFYQEPSDNGVYRGEPESPVEGHDLQQMSTADESDQISFNAAYVNQPLDTIQRREFVKLENCNWTKFYQRIRNFGIDNRKLYV